MTFRAPSFIAGQLLLNPPYRLVHMQFDEDTGDGCITIVDADGSKVEIFAPVRQFTPVLREVLKGYESRLAELPE